MKLKNFIKELQKYPEDLEVIIHDDADWTDDMEVVRTFVKVHRTKHYNYYLTRGNCKDYDELPENYEEKEVIMVI